MVVLMIGDNGASGEGALTGLANEMTFFNVRKPPGLAYHESHPSIALRLILCLMSHMYKYTNIQHARAQVVDQDFQMVKDNLDKLGSDWG